MGLLRGSIDQSSVQSVLPVLITLVQHQPARTIFTRFIPAKSPDDTFGMWQAYYTKWRNVTLDSGNPELVDLLPELQQFIPPATCFDRATYSAFADNRLHQLLLKSGVNTLVISGSETDVCVLATVLTAVDHGYRTIVVSDGLASSSDRSHDALLQLFRSRFEVQIELATAEETIQAWPVS